MRSRPRSAALPLWYALCTTAVSKPDFEPITTTSEASDLVFIGELRILKGVDVLIEAIALLAQNGCAVTASIVGSGPDRAAVSSEGI